MSTQIENKKILLFDIPRNVSTIKDDYNFFALLSNQTYSLKSCIIIIDFHDTEYIDDNVFSIIGAIIHRLILSGNEVIINRLSPAIEDTFISNGFYTTFMDKESTHGSYTNISCGRFTSKEEEKYLQYLDDEFLSQSNLLIISELLKKRILISLVELFNNAHSHGKCNFLYVSGKYFERQNKMCLTLCNIGTTIRTNVNIFLNKQMKGHAAINWAVCLGHTTRTGNIPGGLGFSIIRNFLKVNEGKIQIISSNGMWEENKEGIFEHKLDAPFEGTIINLEFNIDNKSYILIEEIDLKTIF